MILRLKLFLIAAGVLFAGLSLAQEPPAQPDDPPVRLKKKNKIPPEKPEPDKPPMKEEKKDPPLKDKDEPVPTEPQEDEAEVLQRVAKNLRMAEEKLANKELNEGTRQLHDDILKDLDSLIRAAENPQSQDADNQSNPSGGMGQSKSGMSKSGGSRASRNRQRSGTQQANTGKQEGSGNSPGMGQPKQEPQGNSMAKGAAFGPVGNNGGFGGKSPEGPNKNADLYKDVWGHLPEALRAEMNAYSNDKQFMAKYDELIKRYYRTIAEQGRRKGD